MFSPDRIDTAFVDRLLSKCTDHLSLLAAPATLDRVYDFGAEAFDGIFDALRATMPCIVLDVPHQWTGWTQRTLVSADDILIVAAPDLANLRNAKNLFDLLRAARVNDHRPSYCLNQVGVPKRPEIKPADFAKALEDQPVAIIPFEPQMFGTAANNGQMIAEVSSSHRTAEMFRQLAQLLTGRSEVEEGQGRPADAAARQADEEVRRLTKVRRNRSCSASVAPPMLRPAPAAPAAQRRSRRAAPRAAPHAGGGEPARRRCPSAGLGAPLVSAPATPSPPGRASRRRWPPTRGARKAITRPRARSSAR